MIAAQIGHSLSGGRCAIGAIRELAQISKARTLASPVAGEVNLIGKSLEEARQFAPITNKAAIAEKTAVQVSSISEIQQVQSFLDKFSARMVLVGEQQKSANKFFKGATSKSREFKIIDLGLGKKQLEFFSPANNSGYGKLYVHEMDASGNCIIEFKQTLGPEGVINTKLVPKDKDLIK